MWQGLLQVLKALIRLLQARNILVGLLMLPHPPGFSSDPTEKEFSWFIGMEERTRAVFGGCPRCATLQCHLPCCPAEGCGTELSVVLQLRNWGTG